MSFQAPKIPKLHIPAAAAANAFTGDEDDHDGNGDEDKIPIIKTFAHSTPSSQTPSPPSIGLSKPQLKLNLSLGSPSPVMTTISIDPPAVEGPSSVRHRRSASDAAATPKSTSSSSFGSKLKLSLPPLELSPPSPQFIMQPIPVDMAQPYTFNLDMNNNNGAFLSSSSALSSSSSLSSSSLPPDATASKARKLAYYAQQCTQIDDFLFVAGKNIASNLAVLHQHSITRVINCAGDVCENYFEGQGIEYMKFFLLDSASEDIICVLYPAFEFLEESRKQGRNILIHCQQGVSRSTILCIAYLMFLKNADYDEMYQLVRAKRGVCRPNVGFMCQLLAWRKRVTGKSTRPFALYRLAPHCSRDQTVVAKWVDRIDSSSLDDRGVFILQSKSIIFVWIGAQCHEQEIEYLLPIAQKQVQRLQKYEHATTNIHILRQREERVAMEKPLPGQEYTGIGQEDSPSQTRSTNSQNITPKSANRSPSLKFGFNNNSNSNAPTNNITSSSSSSSPTTGIHNGSFMEDSAVGDRDEGYDSPRTPLGPSSHDPPSVHFWYILGGSPHTHFVNHSYDEDYQELVVGPRGKKYHVQLRTHLHYGKGADTAVVCPAEDPSSSGSEGETSPGRSVGDLSGASPMDMSALDTSSSSSSSPSTSGEKPKKHRSKLRSMELLADPQGPSERELRLAALHTRPKHALTFSGTSATPNPSSSTSSSSSSSASASQSLSFSSTFHSFSSTSSSSSSKSKEKVKSLDPTPSPSPPPVGLNPIVEPDINPFSPTNSAFTDKLNFRSPIHKLTSPDTHIHTSGTSSSNINTSLSCNDISMNNTSSLSIDSFSSSPPRTRPTAFTLPSKIDLKSTQLSNNPQLVDIIDDAVNDTGEDDSNRTRSSEDNDRELKELEDEDLVDDQ